MKLECTFSGEKIGFASVEFDEIGIAAIGHQILPSKNFVLFGLEKGFTRIAEENGEMHSWVQVISSDIERPSRDLWSEIHFQKNSNQIILQLRNENFGEEKHVMCVFFLKGGEFYLEKEKKIFQLFEQHKGRSVPISFGFDNKKIEIIAEFDTTMYVIPLGQSEEYWGANYLLAYDLPDYGKLYNFYIVSK